MIKRVFGILILMIDGFMLKASFGFLALLIVLSSSGCKKSSTLTPVGPSTIYFDIRTTFSNTPLDNIPITLNCGGMVLWRSNKEW